jgi:hypothetical protein
MRLFIALMMKTVRMSETWIYFHETTRRNIPESCHLQAYSPSKRRFRRSVIPYMVPTKSAFILEKQFLQMFEQSFLVQEVVL